MLTDLCNTMKFGSLCALGGFTPYPVMSALTHFPEDFRPARLPHSRPVREGREKKARRRFHAHVAHPEIDYGTPAAPSRTSKWSRHLTIDGIRWVTIDGAGRHLDHARRMEPASRSPSSAPPTARRLRLLPAVPGRDRGPRGTPASCTTPVAPGMVVHTQTPQAEAAAPGVMELYISDHPLDCLTCAANGDCELQDMAGAVGLRDVRYGYARATTISREHGGDQTPMVPKDESNPYFTSIRSEVHRLLALRARLRGGAGHLRADHRGPRLRQPRVAGMDEPFLASECVSCGACVQACPTATLRRRPSSRSASPSILGRHHLRLLRRRLLVQGRDEGRRSRAHGALQGRQGQSRPFLRQGPLRLGLCHPQGPHPSR
jgi:ferredoxin